MLFRSKALMCKVFPSSLSQVAKRWFDILKEGSIHSFDGYFEDITVRTFKEGLPTHSNLWKSLTMKPTWGMHQLMDRIEEHKRVEDTTRALVRVKQRFSPLIEGIIRQAGLRLPN